MTACDCVGSVIVFCRVLRCVAACCGVMYCIVVYCSEWSSCSEPGSQIGFACARVCVHVNLLRHLSFYYLPHIHSPCLSAVDKFQLTKLIERNPGWCVFQTKNPKEEDPPWKITPFFSRGVVSYNQCATQLIDGLKRTFYDDLWSSFILIFRTRKCLDHSEVFFHHLVLTWNEIPGLVLCFNVIN